MNELCPYCNSITNIIYKSKYGAVYECPNCNVAIENFIELIYHIFSNESVSLAQFPIPKDIQISVLSSLSKMNNSLPKFLLSVYNNYVILYSFNISEYTYEAIQQFKDKTILSNINPNNFDQKLKIILTYQ
jgi:hypothetical protein